MTVAAVWVMPQFHRSRRIIPRWILSLLVIATLVPVAFDSAAAAGRANEVLFRELSKKTGLRFRHFNGATGDKFFPENMGPGAALLDYDADGDLDVYLIQGKLLDDRRKLGDALFPPADASLGNRLFRNNLIESGALSFVDVTGEAKVGHVGYGMGAAVGDYDGDGYPDIYVTNFGPNVLYHNKGDGTFENVTERAGVDDPRWNSSASFLDYDLDGDLDLIVGTYVDFTVKGNRICHSSLGIRDYCNPSVYRPLPSRLFRNDSKGRFTDVTEAAGLGRAFGPALGIICADFNGDGWTDIYIANDGAANQLWQNKHDGTFEDVGLLSGTAYNGDGMAEAGMGVTTADFDNDGDLDLFMTHLSTETHTLYVNNGTGNFTDLTATHGLSSASNFTGFGTQWFDYDNDGWLDLFVANGAVFVIEGLRGDAYPYHQKNQLFHNDGAGRYADVTALAGPALELSEVSRGAAFGDIDNDGDIDVVVANNNGHARLLVNEGGSHSHWVAVQLRGIHANREGIGARVELIRRGKPMIVQHAHRDGSYLSSNDVRVHFGLGDDPKIDAVVVRWPGGRAERWNTIRADRLVELKEGSGTSLTVDSVERSTPVPKTPIRN